MMSKELTLYLRRQAISRYRSKKVIFVQFILLISLIIFISGYFIYDLSSEGLIYPICLFVVIVFIWSIWSWVKLTNSLFNPYILFLVAAFLFNGGKAFLEVFRLNKYGIENFTDLKGVVLFSFPLSTILQTFLLVALGIVSFHFGALLVAANSEGNFESTRHKGVSPPYQATRIVGWVLLLAALIPTIFTQIDAIKEVLSQGYFRLFERQSPTGLGSTPRILASFLVPGVLFLLAGSKRRKVEVFVSLSTVLIYTIIQFFLGIRLWSAMALIAYIWLWHHWIRPLSKTALAMVGTLLLFIIFPLIPVIRNIPGRDRLSLSFILDSFGSIDNPIIAIISEMGGSVMTVAQTLQLVPSVRDFEYGVGYLYSILTIVPNFFGDIHPAIARELASSWLVATISPGTAMAGGGFGFSFIAEAYLNFGWIGVPFFLCIIGALFAKFVLWTQNSRNPARWATLGSFLAFFLIYTRGESVLVVRALFWYAFIPYFMVWGITNSRRIRF